MPGYKTYPWVELQQGNLLKTLMRNPFTEEEERWFTLGRRLR
jgi:hypothetical protein